MMPATGDFQPKARRPEVDDLRRAKNPLLWTGGAVPPPRSCGLAPIRASRQDPLYGQPKSAGSVLLAQPRREDLELLAILGHRPSRDDQPILLQDVGNLLIRERPPRFLFADDLEDPRLRRFRRDLVSVLGIEARGEEVLQFEHSAWSLHVLVRRYAAHRALMHSDSTGDLLQGQGSQEPGALFEELPLFVDDALHDLDHRAPALFDGLDQPARRRQPAEDEIARFL